MRWRIWLCALAVACAASADPARTGSVWLARPDGCRQCERCRATLREVVADLERAGVRVERSTEHFAPVCMACAVCASGRQFAVRVDGAHADALARLGWSTMSEPPVDHEHRR